jgi:DNA-binding response OmpR family regulator
MSSTSRTQIVAGRVVFVDDDVDTCDLYAEAFRVDGFIVDLASDAVGAFRQIDAAHPDVIVSDLSLPGIDGLEFCRSLKTNAKTTAIPVVLMSGYSGANWEMRAIEAGAERLLTKPLLPEALLEVVRDVLASKGVRSG